MTPPSATVNVGGAVTYSVSISGGSPTPTLASCASSSSAIATASVSGSTCVATGVSAGAVTITATLSSGATVSAALTVQALPAAITNFQLAPSTASIAVGQTVPLTPSVNSPAGATTTVSYSSSNPAVASVSGAGVVAGVSVGTAVITATAQGSGTGFSPVTLTRTSTITVTSAASIAPLTASVSVGAQSTFTVTNPGGSSAVASCASSSTAVATVTASGSTCVATGVSPGTATISATLVAGGPSLQAMLTVTADPCAPTVVTLPFTGNGTITAASCLISSSVQRRGNIARVNLTAPAALEVRMTPTGFAPYIAAVPVGENDFIFSSRQTADEVRRIWHLGAGPVDVRLGALNTGQTGTYQVQIGTVSASIENCTAVIIAGSLTSQQALTASDCVFAGRLADEFLVYSTRPCTITMTRGSGVAGVDDPFLEAYAGTTLVFADDDSGGEFNARLQLASCRSAGDDILTVRATTFDPNDTGTYSLTVVFGGASVADAAEGAVVRAPLKRVPANTTAVSVPRDGRTWLEHIGVERMASRSR
jgi:uncharacterized protein YjdB